MSREAYPTDVSDEEWEFVAPYLTLLREDAAHRVYPLREFFDAVRYMVKAGCLWRMLPNDLPPWTAVQQQAERWRKASCFKAMVHDRRELLRLLQERHPRPNAVVLDGSWDPAPSFALPPLHSATDADNDAAHACLRPSHKSTVY